MADNRTTKQRSETMKAVGTKNTGPELVVRRLIHSRGYRYRIHDPKLPGKPDLVFSSRRKAIFVHGCFWHAHGCRYGQAPKSKLEYWLPKLAENRRRDARQRKVLRQLGWSVLTVWQCQIRSTERILNKIVRFLHDEGR